VRARLSHQTHRHDQQWQQVPRSIVAIGSHNLGAPVTGTRAAV
jgi:hypothetical protein